MPPADAGVEFLDTFTKYLRMRLDSGPLVPGIHKAVMDKFSSLLRSLDGQGKAFDELMSDMKIMIRSTGPDIRDPS